MSLINEVIPSNTVLIFVFAANDQAQIKLNMNATHSDVFHNATFTHS